VKHVYERAASFALSSTQLDCLDAYTDWLSNEATPAGGIGPSEQDRLPTRHLADSLAFARFLPSTNHSVVDIGSGAGLPGIPLAIAHPDRSFVLTDRSGRRTDLLNRAVGVLGLENITVVQAAAASMGGTIELAVTRAVFAPAEWPALARKILRPGGMVIAVVSGSARTPPAEPGLEVVRHELSAEVLDRPVSFLTISKCE